MKTITKIIAVSLAFLSTSSLAATATTYKSPSCGCCTEWVKHLEKNGFDVSVKEQNNMQQIKTQLGITPELASCHTTVIDGYVFEGHVPASDIKNFLKQKSTLVGLAVPGMPMGSPGMEFGQEKDPYDVISFSKDGTKTVFNSHNKG